MIPHTKISFEQNNLVKVKSMGSHVFFLDSRKTYGKNSQFFRVRKIEHILRITLKPLLKVFKVSLQ